MGGESDDNLIIDVLKLLPEITNATHYASPLESDELLGACNSWTLSASNPLLIGYCIDSAIRPSSKSSSCDRNCIGSPRDAPPAVPKLP